MSENRVCYNCRHDIRQEDNAAHIHCYCEVEGRYLSYMSVMEHWCKYWAKDATVRAVERRAENADNNQI